MIFRCLSELGFLGFLKDGFSSGFLGLGVVVWGSWFLCSPLPRRQAPGKVLRRGRGHRPWDQCHRWTAAGVGGFGEIFGGEECFWPSFPGPSPRPSPAERERGFVGGPKAIRQAVWDGGVGFGLGVLYFCEGRFAGGRVVLVWGSLFLRRALRFLRGAGPFTNGPYGWRFRCSRRGLRGAVVVGGVLLAPPLRNPSVSPLGKGRVRRWSRPFRHEGGGGLTLPPLPPPPVELCTTYMDGYCRRLPSLDPPLSFGHFPVNGGNPGVLQWSPGRERGFAGGFRLALVAGDGFPPRRASPDRLRHRAPLRLRRRGRAGCWPVSTVVAVLGLFTNGAYEWPAPVVCGVSWLFWVASVGLGVWRRWLRLGGCWEGCGARAGRCRVGSRFRRRWSA